MKDLNDKIAFITGGAGGLGLAIAKAFGREGMKVMIADIEEQALGRALEELRSAQIRAEGVLCDVAERGQVREAALATLAAFGKVHVVCNNAGVAVGGMLGEISERDWEWVIDVNLKGVVYGVETFVPLIESHGEGGHIVNTASIAGLIAPPGMEPYSATKYAVVAMSEGWRQQLEPKQIGVSALCPGFVRTRINDSERARPARYGKGAARSSEIKAAADKLVNSGIPADPVGARVVEGIKANELYIFTHAEMRPLTEMRFDAIRAAWETCEKSPALKGLVPRELGSLQIAPAPKRSGKSR
jgi:NAD(P)-dependent dehydrogenase (short-subunit alcohol dehydrogenase family)